jgi:hypothetical protein
METAQSKQLADFELRLRAQEEAAEDGACSLVNRRAGTRTVLD